MPSLTPHLCRPCLLRQLVRQSRPFTSSPARRRHGPLATLHPTSSSALNDILLKFRDTVFLPAHLIHLQRTLLYKKKNHPLLTNPDEPATAKLGDEVYQLLPLDHKKDEPNTRRGVNEVIDLMKEANDWKNLPGFLEELHISGRKVQGWQKEKIIRLLTTSNRQATIKDLLRRVSTTGLSLSDLRLAREVIWSAVSLVQLSEPTSESISTAQKYLEDIWELMHDPKHTTSYTKDTDPRRRPEILGVMILVSALRALKTGNGKAEVVEVEKWVTLMMAQWDNAVDAEINAEVSDWPEANYLLQTWSPVHFGILLARKVLPAKSPLINELNDKDVMWLKSVLESASGIVKEHDAASGDDGAQEGKKARRGLTTYEEVGRLFV